MSTHLGKGSERKFLVLVIAVNLTILVGTAVYLYERTRPLRGVEENRAMPKWGERAPDIAPATSVSGERVLLGGDNQHLTVLFFFDPVIANEVASVSSGLHRSFSADVRFVGIFRGTRAEWSALSQEKSSGLIVVPDPERELHRHFRVPTDPTNGATLAITREGEIHLSVDSIVTLELLSDFLARQLGRETENREASS